MVRGGEIEQGVEEGGVGAVVGEVEGEAEEAIGHGGEGGNSFDGFVLTVNAPVEVGQCVVGDKKMGFVTYPHAGEEIQ